LNFKRPFFSVVIPLYNKEAYIADTLKSVLNQSLQDFEVIIVNDGSTDNSLNIVHSFSDNRIKIISTVNGGVSSARNKGISNSQCDYIALLDADDLWEPTYLDEMKELIGRFPGCGFYASAYKVIDYNKEYVEGNKVPEGIIENYFKTELAYHFTRLSATVVCKAAFQKVRGFPIGMISGEDSYFCSMVAINHPIAFTPKILISYNKKFSGIKLRKDIIDNCQESWFDLYKEGDFYLNEFVAYKALKSGIRNALVGCGQKRNIYIEEHAKYTKLFKKKLVYLYILNRLPFTGILLFKKLKPLYSMFRTLI
jgi:glycosyltransferase involved in cell wall biosynthesis